MGLERKQTRENVCGLCLDANYCIGITETRIGNTGTLDFDYNIAGYQFEYISTPLSAGGVGMYVNNELH